MVFGRKMNRSGFYHAESSLFGALKDFLIITEFLIMRYSAWLGCIPGINISNLKLRMLSWNHASHANQKVFTT